MNIRPYLPVENSHCDHCDCRLDGRGISWIDDDGGVYCSVQCGEKAANVRNDRVVLDIFKRALPRLAHQNERTA